MEAPAEGTSNESVNIAATQNIPTETPPTETQKKSKREDRNSKKDDKNIEQFMKSLNSVPSLEEKFSLVCKKYVQTVDDSKKLQFYIKQSDKRYALLLKEKEQLQHESNKNLLVRSKLENLCRELQKQNKAIKEESFLKIREEEERRRETQAKFQSTLNEVTVMLQQNNEKNSQLRDDNISMTEKFKSMLQQYQLREQQVDKMAKQMSLESQLSEAKLQKANLEHQAEKERLISEMEQLKAVATQYHIKLKEAQATEGSLKGQLAVYTAKYDEFQNALVKSNKVFGGFKEQMDQMSKKIKKLEKESLSWKSRWETSQTALIDMCGERQASEEKAAACSRQLLHMQSLCRTLQAERTALLGTLKENNIERPPLPAPAPPPAPAPAPPSSNASVDAMAANCAQLRQSLAHLQNQLQDLTTTDKIPLSQKPKKSKSKKNKQKANTDEPKDETEIVAQKEETETNEIEPFAIENGVDDPTSNENQNGVVEKNETEAQELNESNLIEVNEEISHIAEVKPIVN